MIPGGNSVSYAAKRGKSTCESENVRKNYFAFFLMIRANLKKFFRDRKIDDLGEKIGSRVIKQLRSILNNAQTC